MHKKRCREWVVLPGLVLDLALLEVAEDSIDAPILSSAKLNSN